MNTKTNSIFFYCLLLLCGFTNISKAAITTAVKGNDLHVQSDQTGVSGYQGCEATKLREVPAFIFNLYRAEHENPIVGTCEYSENWQIFTQKPGDNSGKIAFKNLPAGKYKVISYYGVAEGCDLSAAGNGLKNQAIVYHKDTPQIITIEEAPNTAIATGNSLNNLQFKVYPNPASDLISIDLEEGILTSDIDITVFDLLGRPVIDAQSQSGLSNCDYQCQINVGELPAGAFLIRIQDKEGQLLHQEKIMVIRN